ncbi:MAG: PilZ domain-containing protein [Phycisphaeraceae bacterium]|nr:PilZ domain-containing protein [Phycisphaeraceae bacterium]
MQPTPATGQSSSAAVSITAGWEVSTQKLCRQHAVVELMSLSVSGEDLFAPAFRARLLAMPEDGIVIERPFPRIDEHGLDVGGEVLVLLTDHKERWACRCKVLEMTHHPVAGQPEIPAVKLSRPHHVRNAQRRRFYRASTVGITLPWRVLLRPAQEIPSGGYPIEARLLNIGAGGLGVEIVLADKLSVLGASEFFATLNLPTVAEPLRLRVRLVHDRPYTDQSHYLGLQMIYDDPSARRQQMDAIVRFTRWLAEQQVQRRGGHASGW